MLIPHRKLIFAYNRQIAKERVFPRVGASAYIIESGELQPCEIVGQFSTGEWRIHVDDRPTEKVYKNQLYRFPETYKQNVEDFRAHLRSKNALHEIPLSKTTLMLWDKQRKCMIKEGGRYQHKIKLTMKCVCGRKYSEYEVKTHRYKCRECHRVNRFSRIKLSNPNDQDRVVVNFNGANSNNERVEIQYLFPEVGYPKKRRRRLTNQVLIDRLLRETARAQLG